MVYHVHVMASRIAVSKDRKILKKFHMSQNNFRDSHRRVKQKLEGLSFAPHQIFPLSQAARTFQTTLISTCRSRGQMPEDPREPDWWETSGCVSSPLGHLMGSSPKLSSMCKKMGRWGLYLHHLFFFSTETCIFLIWSHLKSMLVSNALPEKVEINSCK